MQRIRTLILIVFIIFLTSCNSSNPLNDPLHDGANLPELFFSDNYWDNFTYSYLKHQEALELQYSEDATSDEIRNAYLQSASYARIALKQAEFEVSVSNHEFYQNLLVKISEFYNSDEEENIFINRLVKEYEEFASDDRTDVNLAYLFARALFLTGDEQNDTRAIQLCSDSLKRLDSEHYKTLFLLASILLKYNEYYNAIFFYNHAFQLRDNVNDTEALKQIAKVYSAKGSFQDAISFYQQYFRLTPISQLHIEDYENYANLHVKLGKLETAEYILTQEVPSQLAVQNKCKHFKLLGIIELKILSKLNDSNSSVNDVELAKEKVLIVRSARLAFEQYLRFYPEDRVVSELLDKLIKDYQLN